MKRLTLSTLLCLMMGTAVAQSSVETARQYLSGHGADDMVNWDFLCTDGRQSGQWTKIGVPSCWELQGFGTYQYGMRFYGKATPEGIANEKGHYRTTFTLPEAWRGRQIWLTFEAVFTDARVTINGRKAGVGLHQGGFTRFQFDVSDRVFFGKKANRLEVEVSKESSNPQVNLAERRADYWNFGGIWRPVFIVAKPALNIQRVAIDAKGDGRFRAQVLTNRHVGGSTIGVEILDAKGKHVAKSPAFAISSDQAMVDFQVKKPQQWNAEHPYLYTAVFTLSDAQGKTLHVERQKFGFRTIEYRHSYEGGTDDGVFVNGKKVIFKGVNRHSFRPETGRTLSKAKNIEDVRLIKSMNMNAVRLSHYPADPEFLDACDSLGLYVECELPGWHWAHETIVGSQLVEEMVTRDVNHPSIIFWSNGNEGGFNEELEPVFHRFDPQQRVVLYPWANKNGFETKHYRSWGETAEYMRQKEIFMPTEFLHGLYDGGHGAGLKDYWQLMMSNPRCAGGFLWDLMDQGVVRTDMNGLVDCMGNFASDGIVGPHMEKEGSYYTIREIWSPIQLTRQGDTLHIANHYDFTHLKDCKMTYQVVALPSYGQQSTHIVAQGAIPSPDIAPHEQGRAVLPHLPSGMLIVTAHNPQGEEVMAWHFAPTTQKAQEQPATTTQWQESEHEATIRVKAHTYVFSKKDGTLQQVAVGNHRLSFGNGPRLVAAKRSDRSQDGFYNHDDKEAFQKKTDYTEYADQGSFDHFSFADTTLTAHYRHGSIDRVEWTFLSDGSVKMTAYWHFNGVVDLLGVAFDYPEQQVQSKQWVGCGPYRVWQNRLDGPQYGYWSNNYNDPIPGESFEYPEFKGYFSDVDWMQLSTTEGKIGIRQPNAFVGVYQPRDGRDHLLYTLPHTGISLLRAIPAVRNKVNTTDLNGPSAQPYWAKGNDSITAIFSFE